MQEPNSGILGGFSGRGTIPRISGGSNVASAFITGTGKAPVHQNRAQHSQSVKVHSQNQDFTITMNND